MTQFTRRRFLGAMSSTVGSIAFVGLTGCSLGGPNGKPPKDAPAPEPEAPMEVVDGSAFFPQSVVSGDPRPDSVIIWTRVMDADAMGEMLNIRVQVSSDETFASLTGEYDIGAMSEDDGVVKVRMSQLSADTTYYYRFVYMKTDGNFASRTGRTKTAPDAGSSREVKFAYVSCQDYIGRYYNTYMKLLDEDLDFIVHLGDYIYETTGDPGFQSEAGDRAITFDDQAGAIAIGEGENRYYSAASLDNYRQLYKTVRSDAVIQQIHERFPMIAIWDDHEFSDDSHGSTSTITSGRENEEDIIRKRRAEQAYFEFMPVDAVNDGETELPVKPEQLYPNSRIYRDFAFGQNLHLVMTDFRTNRPDHLIPEDAFPGTVVMHQASVIIALATQGIDFKTISAGLTPYLNIDDAMFAAYRPVLVGTLTQGYMAEGLAPQDAAAKAETVMQGNLTTDSVNSLLAQYNAAVPAEMQLPLIADEVIATLERGIAYQTLGKSSMFSSLGSRYFVTKDIYDIYAGYKYALDSSTQDAYGAQQEAWYKDKLLGSQARWKIVASSVSHTSLILDLTNPALMIPAPFNQRFYLNVDHWDGFGSKRDELIQGTLANVPGSVIIAGDIHSSYVNDHGQGTFEFTGTSVSSGVFRDLLAATIAGDPLLSSIPGLDLLLANSEMLLQAANPAISYANTNVNGVAVVTAASDGMTVSLFEAEKSMVFENHYDNAEEFVAAMTERQFLVNDAGELEAIS